MLAPEAATRGAVGHRQLDAWRMDPDVPLVVSQVNPDDLAWHEGIIANPNCSTMQLVPPLMALRDAVGIERVIVDTYQSVAGTGHKAIVELEEQIKAHVEGRPKVATVYPHPIAFNALPHIDVFLDNGYTKEEWKVVTESRKILHLPDLRVSCTAVRVPVFVSHSEAVHVETRDPITPAEARALFAGVKGVVVQDDPAANDYPLADERRRARTTCSSGRVRQDPSIDGQSRPGVLGRVGQPAQGRGVQRRRDRRAAARARLGQAASRRSIASAGTRPVRPARFGNLSGRRWGGRVTRDERRAALEAIASEVRVCTRCRLHEGRTKAVPGEGDPDTEVVFVGEGPGFNEDREGRPFVGRAGGLLVQLLGSIGWQREDVFITNVVKCRPPDNRDPQPDEIAACAPYLRRQLEALDPAVVVTLGRYSMATFMPGARIGQVHGTTRARRSRARRRRRRWRSRCTTRRPRSARRARARELRGHRARPGRAAAGAGAPRGGCRDGARRRSRRSTRPHRRRRHPRLRRDIRAPTPTTTRARRRRRPPRRRRRRSPIPRRTTPSQLTLF